MKKIGFYGGCFNPPTKAHIEMANKAIQEYKLDKVIFVPVGDNYRKKEIAKGIDRYNMLKIVSDENDKFEVSDIEIKSSEEYKAIDIFQILSKIYEKDEKFFLMGIDNLEQISNWKESEKLVSNYKYIIFERNNINTEKIIEQNEMLKLHKENFEFIKNDKYQKISSTQIREQIKKAEKPENIDEKVYEYIIKNNIY